LNHVDVEEARADKFETEYVMPILIWIATVVCMMEVAGVRPSARPLSEPDRSKALIVPKRDLEGIDS
jgi:hypothetical protein